MTEPLPKVYQLGGCGGQFLDGDVQIVFQVGHLLLEVPNLKPVWQVSVEKLLMMVQGGWSKFLQAAGILF